MPLRVFVFGGREGWGARGVSYFNVRSTAQGYFKTMGEKRGWRDGSSGGGRGIGAVVGGGGGGGGGGEPTRAA